MISFWSWGLLATVASAVPQVAIPARIQSLSTTTGQRLGLSNSSSTARNISINAAAASSWWYANLDHSTGAVRDYAPFLGDDNYPVYIAIKSGDSQGLQNAILSNGPNGRQRNKMWLANQPRVIYLAPGTYTLNSQLTMTTDTVIIGDAKNPPTIKSSSGFSDPWLVQAGAPGTTYGDGMHGESHFSTMIKNVILDTTASGKSDLAALSWRVAQNSALVNIQINLAQGRHTGIYFGQGSTVQLADVRINYGNRGIFWDGHQQATIKNVYFYGCTTGIFISGGNTLNLFAPTFEYVGRSIVHDSGAPWMSIVDAVSKQSGDFFTSNSYPNFMLENISKDTTDSNMVSVRKDIKIAGSTSVSRYVYGNTYGANPVYQTSPQQENANRPSALLVGGKYPNVSPNQYIDATVADVVNLKDKNQNGGVNVYGDGKTNDGPSLQTAINTATQQGKIAYLPFGVYRTLQTITIPSGTRLIGNGWSTISGYGSKFNDETDPQPIVQVGTPGSTGTADLQDLRFTVGQQLPGAIIVQVNMEGSQPGDVAIHNSLITVGGLRDTELSCSSESNCRGAYIGLHLTQSSSAYINNVWAWVADHASDDSGKGINVAAKGGVLIESTRATWLSGLGSEHFWLYNLSWNKVANAFVSLFQSETNYFQGNRTDNPPPRPFTAKPDNGDPTFSYCTGNAECPMSPAQYFNGGSNIINYASGSWNFEMYTGAQASMNVINQTPSSLQLFGLCDHQTHYIMRLQDGTRFGAGSSDGYGGSWDTLVAKLIQG